MRKFSMKHDVELLTPWLELVFHACVPRHLITVWSQKYNVYELDNWTPLIRTDTTEEATAPFLTFHTLIGFLWNKIASCPMSFILFHLNPCAVAIVLMNVFHSDCLLMLNSEFKMSTSEIDLHIGRADTPDSSWSSTLVRWLTSNSHISSLENLSEGSLWLGTLSIQICNCIISSKAKTLRCSFAWMTSFSGRLLSPRHNLRTILLVFP